MSKPSPVSETGQRGPLQLAEAAADRIYREDAATWLARVDAASDTLQAAVEQAADTDDSAEPLGRLVAALWPYWRLRGQRDAARHWLTAALDRADAPAVRARLLLGAGVLAFEDSDIRTARVSWAELLGSGKERGDPDAEALGLAGLSLVAHRLGDPLRADVLGRSSLARSEAGAGPFAGILARLVRGRVVLSRDDASAATQFADAERLAADSGFTGLRGYALLGSAWAARHAAADTQATGLAEEALAVFEAHADRFGLNLYARFSAASA